MSVLRWFSVLAVFSALAGCGYVADIHVDGPYRIVATDDMEMKVLCRRIEAGGGCAGLVGKVVVEVGFDQTYLVAARLPFDDAEPFDGKPDHPDRTIQYFYVIRSPEGSTLDVVKGPFDEATFKVERDRLNLPRLRPIPS